MVSLGVIVTALILTIVPSFVGGTPLLCQSGTQVISTPGVYALDACSSGLGRVIFFTDNVTLTVSNSVLLDTITCLVVPMASNVHIRLSGVEFRSASTFVAEQLVLFTISDSSVTLEDVAFVRPAPSVCQMITVVGSMRKTSVQLTNITLHCANARSSSVITVVEELVESSVVVRNSDVVASTFSSGSLVASQVSLVATRFALQANSASLFQAFQLRGSELRLEGTSVSSTSDSSRLMSISASEELTNNTIIIVDSSVHASDGFTFLSPLRASTIRIERSFLNLTCRTSCPLFTMFDGFPVTSIRVINSSLSIDGAVISVLFKPQIGGEVVVVNSSASAPVLFELTANGTSFALTDSHFTASGRPQLPMSFGAGSVYEMQMDGCDFTGFSNSGFSNSPPSCTLGCNTWDGVQSEGDFAFLCDLATSTLTCEVPAPGNVSQNYTASPSLTLTEYPANMSHGNQTATPLIVSSNPPLNQRQLLGVATTRSIAGRALDTLPPKMLLGPFVIELEEGSTSDHATLKFPGSVSCGQLSAQPTPIVARDSAGLIFGLMQIASVDGLATTLQSVCEGKPEETLVSPSDFDFTGALVSTDDAVTVTPRLYGLHSSDFTLSFEVGTGPWPIIALFDVSLSNSALGERASLPTRTIVSVTAGQVSVFLDSSDVSSNAVLTFDLPDSHPGGPVVLTLARHWGPYVYTTQHLLSTFRR